VALANKQAWIEQGLQIVAEQGALALTIEVLCTQLGLTKGSFYHHFKNFQDYKEALLGYYEEAGTLQIIQLVETVASPQAKIEKLLELTLIGRPSLEVGVRAWALQDLSVQVYQERIDKQRLNYLQQLCEVSLDDQVRAKLAARLLYALFVGSQQLRPPIEGAELRQLYQELQQFYHLT
jgi:AcrR family transcriptional regulator